MENLTPVRVTGEGVRRLVDLHSVLHDLQWVQVACVLSIKHMAAQGNAVVVESLQIAALVRYCRTFESTPDTRFSLATDILKALPADLQQAHHEFCVLRDLYIAHSGDDLLWNIPMAHVHREDATGKQQVSWLTVEHSWIVAPSRDSMVSLYELARRLIAIVLDEIEKEKSRALAMMNSQTLAASEAAQDSAAVLKPAGD